MATAKFRFQRRFWADMGPVFAEWHPKGPEDAIGIGTSTANAELRVWYEYRGYSGMQNPIDAGRSEGELEMSSLKAEQLKLLGGSQPANSSGCVWE